MSVVLLGEEGSVYATRRGRHFHEGSDCVAMLSGQVVHMCRCGDVYCGCAGEVPAKPRAMSIGDAAMEGLKPCAVCYPGFDELDVQLPADEHFGHRVIDEYGANRANVSREVCERCTNWKRIKVFNQDTGRDEFYRMGRRVSWPCLSARILGLAPREEGKIT